MVRNAGGSLGGAPDRNRDGRSVWRVRRAVRQRVYGQGGVEEFGRPTGRNRDLEGVQCILSALQSIGAAIQNNDAVGDLSGCLIV